ncbi:MAG: 4Fe-4S binding protein [Candidatus Omnitrophica bacterium]|nr:4Fe-4S binding protein [Candidatus Omnitrophota bacterium]
MTTLSKGNIISGIKNSVFFWLFALIGIFFASMAYSESSLRLLYFFWRPPFSLFIKIICAASFALLIIKWVNQKLLPYFWLKFIGGLIFLPVILLPVFRCYFKVPYVFCRACPDKCPWGISRTFLFGAFVGLNLSGKFWCARLCPLGSFQEAQVAISKKHLKPAAWLSVSSYVILIAVAAVYFLTVTSSAWVKYFGNGWYAWAWAAVFIAAAILSAAFFIPKFWCRYFCPVGAIADISGKCRRMICR